MIQTLPFASALVYAPRGQSAISLKSQKLRDRIKRADAKLLIDIADHVADLIRGGEFPGFFGEDVTLVPVPGHAPLWTGAVGSTSRIAEALRHAGIAGNVDPCLERAERVPKSAFVPPDQRPRAQDHFASLRVRDTLVPPRRIVLVDDFVTRGATLIGAASRLLEQWPDSDVKAFALVRSITPGEIGSIRQPCVGTIELRDDGETFRLP